MGKENKHAYAQPILYTYTGSDANTYQTLTSPPPGGLQTLTKLLNHVPLALTFQVWSKYLHFGARLPLSAPLNPPSPQHSHRLRASGRKDPHTPENSGLYSFSAPFYKKPELEPTKPGHHDNRRGTYRPPSDFHTNFHTAKLTSTSSSAGCYRALLGV